MDQHQTPLYDKLKNYVEQDRASFHVPGHKFGQDLDSEMYPFLRQVMSIDYTEITDLDDLHHPQGVIKHAQELAASCFQADKTFFLVNGSTVGNIALILAVCQRNDYIIVQRNAHKSILHGLMLAGVKAVFLTPHWDEASGLATGVRREDVEAALEQYPQAKAVFLTNPNYYGMGIHLRSIAEVVHSHDKPLLIDEAHGAHYGFHPGVPESALSCGADAVVQSTHKMLTALTMGAMLHIQGHFLQPEVIQQRLSMLQSSSPSYPIMASLDVSRRLIAVEGEKRIDEGLQVVNQFKQSLRELPWFQIVDYANTAEKTQDPFKVIVKDRTGTCSGYELRQQLEKHGCMIEMADPSYAVLFFSLSSKPKDSERLIEAFRQISKHFSLEKQELHEGNSNINIMASFPLMSSPILLDILFDSVDGAAHKKIGIVKLEDAVHRSCAEMIIPYPPGIPILYPGEMITSEMVQFIQQLSLLGATFQGAREAQINTLQVFK